MMKPSFWLQYPIDIYSAIALLARNLKIPAINEYGGIFSLDCDAL